MLSRGLRMSLRAVRLSSSQARVQVQAAETSSVSSSVSVSPAPESASQAANCFNAIMYKGRQKNLIGIRELKFLFNAVEAPGDVKYAGLGVDWYQEKGYDFSEELNALFVDACVRGRKPEVAVSRFIYGKGRIGAWSTANSLNKLFENLRENNDAQAMVDVLEVLMPKRVRINNVTVILCLSTCSEVKSRHLYERVLELTQGTVDNDYMEKILSRHPIPEEEVNETVNPDEEAEEQNND